MALPESNVIHAGYGSYAVIEVDLDGGDKAFYFVAFRAFSEIFHHCLKLIEK
ncbi:heat shock protein C [Escherichia coli DEC5A]|nr:heat shock protein C [Escherichia coli DEC5A]